jgi:hypothetical protein
MTPSSPVGGGSRARSTGGDEGREHPAPPARTRGASLLDVSLRLAETPCSPLEMESPPRATGRAFLGETTRDSRQGGGANCPTAVAGLECAFKARKPAVAARRGQASGSASMPARLNDVPPIERRRDEATAARPPTPERIIRHANSHWLGAQPLGAKRRADLRGVAGHGDARLLRSRLRRRPDALVDKRPPSFPSAGPSSSGG